MIKLTDRAFLDINANLTASIHLIGQAKFYDKDDGIAQELINDVRLNLINAIEILDKEGI